MNPTLPEFPKVTILECHSMPDLVGKEARIISYADPEMGKYPVQIILVSPIEITIQTPFGEAKAMTVGPFPFRPEELELIQVLPEKLSDALENAFKDIDLDPEKKPKEDEKNDAEQHQNPPSG